MPPRGLRTLACDPERVPHLSDLQVLQLLLPVEDGLQTADPDVDVSHQHRLPDAPDEDAQGGAQVLQEVLDEAGVLVVVEDWNAQEHRLWEGERDPAPRVDTPQKGKGVPTRAQHVRTQGAWCRWDGPRMTPLRAEGSEFDGTGVSAGPRDVLVAGGECASCNQTVCLKMIKMENSGYVYFTTIKIMS